MRDLAKTDSSPLGAVVVGGGPAGAGLLVAARGAGLLDALLALPVRIIECGDAVGTGELGGYAIRSDSHAESFLRAVEAQAEPPLSVALSTPAGREVSQRRGGPVDLSVASAFLNGACEELRGALAASGRDPFLNGFEALSARKTTAGGWRVRCRRVARGDEAELDAAALVLATGAHQPPETLLRERVAGEPLLPRFAGRLVQSSALLSHSGAAAAIGRLAKLASPRVAIVGGSHSAIACARLLLDAAPGLSFGEDGVAVLHRRPLRLTYASPAAALAEGYAEFGPQDICAHTGRVFPLAGFRSDARDLLRRAWGLGGCGPEPRLRLHRLRHGPDAEAARILEDADLVVAALGYRPRALPLFDSDGRRIRLHAETAPAAPLVDGRSRVLAADGAPVEGVFGIGLAAGFPLRGTHGEESFEGQANGLSLWHGEVGAAIVRDLLAARPAAATARVAPGFSKAEAA
ncbi:hypothetical protein GCM10009416_44420 [Craurococcus roseus]|uniref:FAD/NAD(P)-binding domain-containing protein n=1 Tax=Craurococcus roseus TaxID=77585 RepID=A0ABN1G0H8_9PROT